MIKNTELLILERINEKLFMYESEFSGDELVALCGLEEQQLIVCDDLQYSLTDDGFCHMIDEQRRFLNEMQKEYENRLNTLSEKNRKLAEKLYDLKQCPTHSKQKSSVYVYTLRGANNLKSSLKYPLYIQTNSNNDNKSGFIAYEYGVTVDDAEDFMKNVTDFLSKKHVTRLCVREVD